MRGKRLGAILLMEGAAWDAWYKTPVRSGVEPAAKQDNLASLLLKVHVDELNCLLQLGVKESSGNIIKGVIILSTSSSIVGERRVHFLRAGTWL